MHTGEMSQRKDRSDTASHQERCSSARSCQQMKTQALLAARNGREDQNNPRKFWPGWTKRFFPLLLNYRRRLD